LPKDTALAFLCHSGGRSARAAEHFRGLGFSTLLNVDGGIDAWSRDVDSSVPALLTKPAPRWVIFAGMLPATAATLLLH